LLHDLAERAEAERAREELEAGVLDFRGYTKERYRVLRDMPSRSVYGDLSYIHNNMSSYAPQQRASSPATGRGVSASAGADVAEAQAQAAVAGGGGHFHALLGAGGEAHSPARASDDLGLMSLSFDRHAYIQGKMPGAPGGG